MITWFAAMCSISNYESILNFHWRSCGNSIVGSSIITGRLKFSCCFNVQMGKVREISWREKNFKWTARGTLYFLEDCVSSHHYRRFLFISRYNVRCTIEKLLRLNTTLECNSTSLIIAKLRMNSNKSYAAVRCQLTCNFVLPYWTSSVETSVWENSTHVHMNLYARKPSSWDTPVILFL